MLAKRSKKNSQKGGASNIKSKRNMALKIMMNKDLLELKNLIEYMPHDLEGIERLNYFVFIMSSIKSHYQKYQYMFPYVQKNIKESVYNDINEHLFEAQENLKNNYLKEVDLSNEELFNYNFHSANLEDADFSNSIINHCNFTECILENATFDEAKIGDSYFSNASCRNTNFTKAQIVKSHFNGVDLAYSEFNKTQLEDVDLSYAENTLLASVTNIIMDGTEYENGFSHQDSESSNEESDGE
jgi:hypothetical protein